MMCKMNRKDGFVIILELLIFDHFLKFQSIKISNFAWIFLGNFLDCSIIIIDNTRVFRVIDYYQCSKIIPVGTL